MHPILTVAAIFVDPGGVYACLPCLDVWGPARDARLYTGPYPVVAHPPCARWGWHARQFGRLGEDEGRFASALASLDRWMGILEHPAGSSAWERFGVPAPGGWGWTPAGATPDGRPRWTCSVEQGHYGHPCPKRSWLLCVPADGARPPPLRWGPSGATGRVVRQWTKREREATPAPFAELLLGLVRGTGDRSSHPGTGDRSSHPGTGDEDQVAGTCDAIEGSGPQPVTGPGASCPVCGGPVTYGRRGPRAAYCRRPACRQRASRQARAEGAASFLTPLSSSSRNKSDDGPQMQLFGHRF